MQEFKKLLKSFTYAFSGIFTTIRNERNLRIHITCLIYMFSILGFTDWFTLSRADWAILVIASGMVISCEIINTAIENAVNLASEEYTQFGKIAKDAAAGAVLVSVFFAIAVGLIIMLQPQAFIEMFNYFVEKPLMFAILVVSLIPATLFIFMGNPFKRGNNK